MPGSCSTSQHPLLGDEDPHQDEPFCIVWNTE
jgi:hypothetical protein